MTPLDSRKQRITVTLQTLQTSSCHSQQQHLLRQLITDCNWLRIGAFDAIRQHLSTSNSGQALTILAPTEAFRKECCGKVFTSQVAYNGHKNAKRHRHEQPA